MIRSIAVGRRFRRARLRPTVQALEARLLLTGGRLDSTFGGGTGYYLGSVNPGNGTGLTNLNLVQVESDNNAIFAAGPVGQTGSPSFGVIRLNADGTPDTSFGTNGEADVALPGGLPTDFALAADPSSLLIQTDDKILVVGTATALGSNSTTDYAVVARFDINGQPDTTFGTSGVEVVDLNTLGLISGRLPYATIQPDNGRIVLVGSSLISNEGLSPEQIAAVRLNGDGTVDTAFGTNGVVTVSNLASSNVGLYPNESSDGVAVQASGKIVILANITYQVPDATPSIPELIRLNADGSRDTTISQAGLNNSGLTVPDDLIQQPDGELLVLGLPYTPNNYGPNIAPILARLNADGTLGTRATLPTINGVTSSLTGFALQPDGDVVVSIEGSSGNSGAVTTNVIRLTPSLAPDVTFGTNGESTISVKPTGSAALVLGPLAVGTNDQVVLVGSNQNSDEGVGDGTLPTDVAVVRLTATAPAVSGDYTGDGISDPAVYLTASGLFVIRPSSGGPDQITAFGIPGAGQTIPAPGDYTGSGVEEIAAYLSSYGVYAYRPAGGGPDVLQPFGIPGVGQSIPAPGDYFGTGQDDIAVYMPSIGSFGIRNPAGGPDEIIPFGFMGAGQTIPAPGDYFGTGQTDIAAYLPSIGAFAIRNPAGGPDEIIPFGISGLGNSIPIPGDYDGSGKTELAVYLPKLGEFAYRPANGGSDVIVPFGAGNDGSLPVPGDYDGSGKTEIAIYDPNHANFAYRPADGGPDVIEQFGIAGAGQSIPTATPSGALPQYNGISAASVHAESESSSTSTVVPANSILATKGLTALSGLSATSKRISLLSVNQAEPVAIDGLL